MAENILGADEREAFEDWAIEQPQVMAEEDCFARYKDRYEISVVQNLWLAWQARAALAAPAVVVSAEPVAASHMLPRGWTAGQLDADTFFLKKLGVGAGSFGKNDERARISVVAEFLSEMLATPVGTDAVDALIQARAAIRWLTFGEKEADGSAPRVSDVLAQIDAALASTRPSKGAA